ncbi:transcription factor IIIA-like [Pelodytes ibericus]
MEETEAAAAVAVAYKPFICSFPDCNKAYNKDWKLQAHLCIHTGVKPFHCDYEGCNKGFTSAYHLNRHSLTHSGERNYKCESEECELMFSTKANMKKHFNRAHAYQGQIYVCDFPDCNQKFKKHNKLKIHQCTHTNQQPYKCTYEGCDKSFSFPSRLKRHEKVHAGYKCKKEDVCTFVGKTWSDYLHHVSTCHEEPAICDVCNRRFKNKTYLKEHKQIHEDKQIVYCCPREGCDRTYTTAFNLQSHIVTFHEEVRSFICEHAGCGKTFALKKSLERHSVVHDPEKKKLKEKKPRPKRSLASRLSGYRPSKMDIGVEPAANSVIENDNLPQAPEANHSLLEQLSLK